MMYRRNNRDSEILGQEQAVAQSLIVMDYVNLVLGYYLSKLQVCSHREGENLGEHTKAHCRYLVEIERGEEAHGASK